MYHLPAVLFDSRVYHVFIRQTCFEDHSRTGQVPDQKQTYRSPIGGEALVVPSWQFGTGTGTGSCSESRESCKFSVQSLTPRQVLFSAHRLNPQSFPSPNHQPPTTTPKFWPLRPTRQQRQFSHQSFLGAWPNPPPIVVLTSTSPTYSHSSSAPPQQPYIFLSSSLHLFPLTLRTRHPLPTTLATILRLRNDHRRRKEPLTLDRICKSRHCPQRSTSNHGDCFVRWHR